MNKPRSLMVLMPLPSSGLIPQEVHSFLTRLRLSFWNLGVEYEEIILPGLDQAQCRAELLAYYYAHRDRFDDALFLDSDMLTGENVIHELCRLSDEIVFCPYPQRKRDDDALASSNPLQFWAVDTANTEASIEIREGRRMVALRGGGLGCCRLRRSAVEKLYAMPATTLKGPQMRYLTPTWTSFVPGMKGITVRGLFECITHEHVGTMKRRSEDMSFFLRCAEVGIQPYALCDATMWHAGKTGMSLWDALCHQERERKRVRRRASFQLIDCPDNLAGGLCEVLDGAYDIPGLEIRPDEVILDIGANIGAFAIWAVERFPGCHVYCFEPEPKNYERLERNTDMYSRIITRKAAVCGTATLKGTFESGSAMLSPGFCNDGEWSVHPVDGVHDMTKSIPVATAPAKNLPPCSILKIDTEGCELEILQEYRWLDGCTAIMLEWHSLKDYHDIMGLMREKGFVPMVDRAKGKPSEHRELCFVRKVMPAEREETFTPTEEVAQ